MNKKNQSRAWLKKLISELLIFLIQKLNGAYKSISINEAIENKFLFDDLTPVDYADKEKKYEASLLWALRNKNIKNIALTGPYGSGKSSVLRTFEANHKEFNFLNISLGTFSVPQAGDAEGSQVAHIEKSILQQIFYKVKKQAIPYSRFNRIKNVKFTTYLFKASFLAIWVLSIIYIDDPYKQIFHALLTGSSYYTQYYYLASVLFALFGFITILNQIFQHFSHSKLNKISVTSGEIEFEDIVSDSILNRHLDEILYFFEKTKFDVVVIEDLDRFEKIDIFVKLREINCLINNSDQIDRNIVFIYAIKDDVFKDTNRTKFFDFIIPIIPIINSSNSGEMLLKKLSQTSHVISTSFIKVLTLYVDDMRMLKNIYNEFVIYKENLCVEGKNDLKLDKLLGLIVYKNKYPSDFALLNENKGMVAGVFENKNQIVNDLNLDINIQIQELELKLKEIESEGITSIKDLRRIYVSGLYEKLQNCSAIYISGVVYSPVQLVEDEPFRLLKNQSTYNYYPLGGSGTQASSLSFRDIEKFVMPQATYDEREELIKQKLNGEVDEIKRKIKESEENIKDIKSLSLRSLAEKFPDGDFFEGAINDHKLLIYLLRNGYIDEMYQTFISYFYEGTITRDDRAFILSVNDKEPLAYTHSLGNIAEILDQLKPVNFKTEAILNFDLLNFLLVEDTYRKDLDYFIEYLATGGEIQLEFIDSYIQSGTKYALLFRKISTSYIDFWSNIINKCDYQSDYYDFYFKLLFENSELSSLIRMNVGESISDYITTTKNFFELSSELSDQKKLQNLLLELGIRFRDFVNPEFNFELFQFVVEKDLYEINQSVIDLIIKTLKLIDTYEFGILNYTNILRTKNKNLINNIENNINSFVSNVLLKIDSYEETEGSFIDLLNNETLEINLKRELLTACKCTITNLSDIDDIDIKREVLSYAKVKPNWLNVLTYFSNDEELDETLITFLNNSIVFVELANEKLKVIEGGDFSEELVKRLSLKLMNSTELSNDSYAYIIKSIYYWYSSPSSFSTLSEFNLKVLIENTRVRLNEAIFNWVQGTHPKLLPLLVEKSIQNYLASIGTFPLNGSGIEYLLKSQAIHRDQKLKIINNIDVALLAQSTELVTLAYNTVTAAEASPEMPQLIFDELLKNIKGFEEKLKLLANQLSFLDAASLRQKLLIIGLPISDVFKNNRQPKLFKNSSNEKLAKRLEELELISSYSLTDIHIKLVPKRKKK